MVHRNRRFLIAAAALVCALGTTVAAGATPAASPASAFAAGFFTGDAHVCSIASADMQAYLARITKTANCAAAMAVIRQGVVADADAAEKTELQDVKEAALSVGVQHYGGTSGKQWFDKKFSIAKLATAIHAEKPDLRVRLGNGPAAARGSAANAVFVDTVRSTPKLLVLYGESAGGAILRLGLTPAGKASFARSAVRGIAALPPAPKVKTFDFAPAAATDSTLVIATLTLRGGIDVTDLLLSVGSDGRVQSMYVGRALAPPVGVVGGADGTAFSAALTATYSAADANTRCSLFEPQFVKLLGGDDCSVVGKAAPAADVTTPTQRVVAADGTTVVAVRLGNAPNQLTVMNLVVSTAGGYRVTGVFLDLADLI